MHEQNESQKHDVEQKKQVTNECIRVYLLEVST